jgi:GTP-binding protein
MSKAFQGDIVSIAGFPNSTVTHTLLEDNNTSLIIPSVKIDPPMMAISVNVNTSPLAGKEGDKLTLNDIKNRVVEESENDVALLVEATKNKTNAITIRGRGDLHLGVLMEKMRREGFEMSITPPEILFKTDPKTKELLEPVEKVEI